MATSEQTLQKIKETPYPRPLYAIAIEIKADWKNPSIHAVPYLDVLAVLPSIDSQYGLDSGSTIVVYFLSNALTWRGETARRIKKELNKMLKEVREIDRVSTPAYWIPKDYGFGARMECSSCGIIWTEPMGETPPLHYNLCSTKKEVN